MHITRRIQAVKLRHIGGIAGNTQINHTLSI